ncbi:hypothetical protein CVT24_004440 [Panaeolus cyanescens]|uniref:PCI domain-containing protein n=1 Tax=Panaeolus cyanescens TaxID=181874 RepID=A0A409YBJ6_9AGAR|nr:hypothetical protein CVT24_004440 [Panaeolus cyanescens]
MAEDLVLPIPNLTVPQNLFVLSNPAFKALHEKARTEILEAIKADDMAPYLKSITSTSPPLLTPHASLLAAMESKNTEELRSLDERLEQAQKTEGESEISDALKARANYLTRIGDKDRAIAAQNLALEKTPGLGSRIDIVLTLARIGFFFGDNELVTTSMEKAEKLIDSGGDWDRRNRLKVYRGVHLVSIRQFKRASELLLDALSTFTATELLSYNDFVSLTVIVSALVLGRVDLKKKVIGAPEVNSVLPEVPVLGELVRSLYECHYDKFFVALATLEQSHLLPSRILSPHTRYYIREMRILAYTQLLESYQSLTLKSMSEAFGVGVGWVDSDLSQFIATSRIPARIDRVNGVVETMRVGVKSGKYEEVVRRGDVLLNEVQRLSKVLY